MQGPGRRLPSPPPQQQESAPIKTVTWHDFLKETKEVSWQEALLETHFEAQRAPNKNNLSSWQDFLRQTSDTSAVSSSPSPPDSPKLDHEPQQESKEKGRISPVSGTSPSAATGTSPPAGSNDLANRVSNARPPSQMPSKEPKVTGNKEKGLVCKLASQPNLEELSQAQLPANANELQQLICKKNPQLRMIASTVFPSLGNLTVLWIEKAALQELSVDMFTLTKLEHLFLGHNQIREIPAEIGRLVNLKKLNLQHNQIVDLPQTLRHLTQLRSLYAHYNNLLRLPVGLCELEQLKEITVQYNPLITPPAFVCTKGVDDIKKWLQYINQVVNEAPQRNKINFTRNMSFTTSDDSFGILRKDGVHVSTRNPWFVETNPHIFFILDAASASTSGRREYMEDRHLSTQLTVRTQADMEANYYGIYDGHCGDNTAEYLKQNMHKILERQPDFHPNTIEAALSRTYAESEAGWMAVAKAQTPYIPSGSTALSLVILQNSLTVAWCGDSRAVICQGTKATRLSRDHKPKLPDEEKRIKDLGGIVDVSDEGVYRVMGVLAVSRALGDIDLKEPVPYVSPVPEVKSMVLTPRDQFIIAASDGVWDVFSDQSAVDMVRRHGTAQEAADAIVGHVNARKAKDNATCTVIMLHWDVRFPSRN